jgi:hypothetical protein
VRGSWRYNVVVCIIYTLRNPRRVWRAVDVMLSCCVGGKVEQGFTTEEAHPWLLVLASQASRDTRARLQQHHNLKLLHVIVLNRVQTLSQGGIISSFSPTPQPHLPPQSQ